MLILSYSIETTHPLRFNIYIGVTPALSHPFQMIAVLHLDLSCNKTLSFIALNGVYVATHTCFLLIP